MYQESLKHVRGSQWELQVLWKTRELRKLQLMALNLYLLGHQSTRCAFLEIVRCCLLGIPGDDKITYSFHGSDKSISIAIKHWTRCWISSILIGWMVLGYQFIYLLRPNMINEHSTTKSPESFSPRVTRQEKRMRKITLQWTKIKKKFQERHWDTNQSCSGVLYF